MSEKEVCPTDGAALTKDPDGELYCCFKCGTFYREAKKLL